MKLLHRLTCLLRGHVSYERINVPNVPPEPLGTITSGNLVYNTVDSMLQVSSVDAAGNMRFVPVTPRNSISYTAGPMEVSLHVCARCHYVYWNTQVRLPTLGHANSVPELADFVKWRKREAWEQKQREANEVVGGAWRGYQMALKMTQGIEPDPPQTN